MYTKFYQYRRGFVAYDYDKNILVCFFGSQCICNFLFVDVCNLESFYNIVPT